MKTAHSRTLQTADFKLPLALIALSLVPLLGGVIRLLSVARPAAASPENVRFLHAPAPVVIHIFSATLFCILGAFQFSRGFRLRWPGLHRRAGRVLGALGLVTAATGFWMTAFYDIPTSMQGPLLYVVRLLVASAMFACIVLAWRAILRRNVPGHEAFMIRAYAIGQGAGTQVVILMPWMLISGQSGGLTRDILMTLSWLLNVVLAEAIIQRRAEQSAEGRGRPSVA